MNNRLYEITEQDLSFIDKATQQKAITSLESGQVIYFPNYFFALKEDENALLSETVLDPKHKNISYDYNHQKVAGLRDSLILQPILHQFMHRFAQFSRQLVDTALPHYRDALRWGRTSYRPAQIRGRKTSKRKDDTRLHVDSFSATPVNGLRILRVFCNINPNQEPRVWHVGEPFSQVLTRFAPHIPTYSLTRAKILKLFKTTKTLRSAYDHYMLHLHDSMKLDDDYQKNLTKDRIDFPQQSTWIVYTDHVSHAALSGQFLLEQTFYLPPTAMQNPELSPLKQWEKEKGRLLVRQ